MAARKPRPRRELDLVVYGASGFVGAQVVRRLAAEARGIRVALAGRDAAKLDAVRSAAGLDDAEVVVADADDAQALARLAARTRVVLSTAGPYATYGDTLVAACVASGTHWVDITGETPWVRRVIDRHDDEARKTGACIVPGCGFDSVPSDLGAWLVADALWRTHGESCVEVKAAFSMRGGLNGGTFASLVGAVERGERAQMADPFLLNPAGTRPEDEAPHRDPLGARRDADLAAWLAPFVMGAINTRVVRRSTALRAAAGVHGGVPVAYQEYLRIGRGPGAALVASGVAAGMAAGMAAIDLPFVRACAEALAPRPGQGPSEAAIDGGMFRCDVVGRTASGRVQRGRIAGRGDPGNRATTVFVVSSALALLDVRKPPAGVLTPSVAFGDALANRLAAAGMTVEPLPAGA